MTGLLQAPGWRFICFPFFLGAGVLGVGVTDPVGDHMLPLFGVCHQHYLRRRHMSSSLTPSVAIFWLSAFRVMRPPTEARHFGFGQYSPQCNVHAEGAMEADGRDSCFFVANGLSSLHLTRPGGLVALLRSSQAETLLSQVQTI